MERTKNPFRLMLYSTLAWGFAAHGVMLLNKFSFHDDAHMVFHVGATVSSGRWMLELLGYAGQFLFGGALYSLPLFNGLVSLLLIAFAGGFLAKIFRIERTLSCVALAGILTTFPAVAALFGYMYTAPYYLLGLDLTLLGVWLICSASRERPVQFLLGCVFAACGTGVYQAYLCVALTIMLLYMMMSLRYDPADRRFRFFCKGLSLAGASLLILVLYLAATRLALHLAGTELTDYESISSFGFSGWERYLDRVRRAYAEFFWPPAGKMRDMYPTAALYWLYEAVLSLGILLALDRAWQLFRAKKRRGIEFLFLLALFPLCVNFVHVMVDVQLVHSLMVYSKALTFMAFICLLEGAALDRRHYPRWLYWSGVSLMLGISALYCHYDNVCYFKADIIQNQAREYFTRLVTRIESLPGYSPELPVVYINERNKRDPNAPRYAELDRVRLLPYLFNQNILLINNYAWKDFMSLWCGFSPTVIQNAEKYERLPEVLAMPRYPADGSVRIVNGAVVVRF